MDQIILKKKEAYHQSIRKAKYEQKLNEKRIIFQQKFKPLKKSAQQLIKQIEQLKKQNKQYVDVFEDLVIQLQSEYYEEKSKEQIEKILTQCSILFIGEFVGANIRKSNLALFALSNLCIDYDKTSLIQLKSQFMDFLLQQVEQERKKRGQFDQQQFENIKFIYANFLNSNSQLLSKEQTILMLNALSYQTDNQTLIYKISEAIQKFIRNSENRVQYEGQLLDFVQWSANHLKEDNSTKITQNLARILNILINQYHARIGIDDLNQMMHIVFRHIISVEERIKIPIYMTLATIVKVQPALSLDVMHHFSNKLLTRLSIQQPNIKTYILGVFNQMLKGSHGIDIIDHLRKTKLFDFIIQLEEEVYKPQFKQYMIEVISKSIELIDDKQEQILFMKQLEQLRILETLQKLMNNSSPTISQMATELYSKFNEGD